MKRILTSLALLGSLASYGQSNIYNPDSDNDGLITVEDLMIFLSNFGSDFTPNPCNCGCNANPFYEPFATYDTLTTYEVASNIFYSQPDSVKLDFVIAPYGTGWMPFSDIDTLFYDTLAFTQTFDRRNTDLDGNNSYYGSGNPHMVFRNDAYTGQLTSTSIHGGLDIFDINGASYSMRVEAASICPNLNNDEYWTLFNSTSWFQVEPGVYVNVFEYASSNVPSNPSAEFPTSWTMFYPLNWLVITEIHDEPSEE